MPLVFIENATNHPVALRFVPPECTAGYLAALLDRVLPHGRPLAFYPDRHGPFRAKPAILKAAMARPNSAVPWRPEIGLIHGPPE